MLLIAGVDLQKAPHLCIFLLALLGDLAGFVASLEETGCEKKILPPAQLAHFKEKQIPGKSFLPLPLYGRNGLGSLEWLLDP